MIRHSARASRFVMPTTSARCSTRNTRSSPTRVPDVWSEAVYNSPAHNPGKRARPRSPRSPARKNLAFRSDDGRSPSNDDSRSWRSRDGGSDGSNGSHPRPKWDSAEVQVDAETFINTLASSSTRDLCSVLFNFFGKQIAQPRRDLFEKATGLSMSHSAAPRFLTQVESDAACAMAR